MVSGGKRRVVSRTALVYCEGAHDLAFMIHLINMYGKLGRTTCQFRSKHGKGGSVLSLVGDARNIPGDFNKRLVKADCDRDPAEIDKAKTLASESGIVVVWSSPCIEALLLSIIYKKDYSRYKSKTCKKIFEKQHIPTNKRTDSRAYEKIYTFEIVEEARKRLPELELLASFITD